MNQERLASIRDMVRKTYTDTDVVSRYAHIGLWPAEEILVLEYFPDNAQVLDLGCGAGRTTIPHGGDGIESSRHRLQPVDDPIGPRVG